MSAQKLALAIIDTWLNHRAAQAGLPGLQASIRKGGRLVFSKAYGCANLKTGEPYTPDHVGRLASHSKMFTACLALQMQAGGALRLDDPVVVHLPQFKAHPDKRFKHIALRDLLANRSGLFRDGHDAPFWELQGPFLSREELQQAVLTTRLVYAPNTCTKYSNIGFSLMGLALEAAGKADYATLVTRHVLSKLGAHTLLPDYPTQKTAQQALPFAYGHTRNIYNGQRRVFKHAGTNAMAAATGFCGNTDSISHFVHALYNTDKLLPQAARRELAELQWPVHNMNKDTYGLGTTFSQTKGMVFMGHGGAFPGFSSRTQALLGTDYVFSVITNCNAAFDNLTLLRSMAEFTRTVSHTFTAAEAATAVLSPLMANKWGTRLYVIGSKKALQLPLDSWSPFGEAETFSRRKDGLFYNDGATGYGNVGEPLHFTFNGKTLVTAKYAADTLYPLEAYLKRSESSLL